MLRRGVVVLRAFVLAVAVLSGTTELSRLSAGTAPEGADAPLAAPASKVEGSAEALAVLTYLQKAAMADAPLSGRFHFQFKCQPTPAFLEGVAESTRQAAGNRDSRAMVGPLNPDRDFLREVTVEWVSQDGLFKGSETTTFPNTGEAGQPLQVAWDGKAGMAYVAPAHMAAMYGDKRELSSDYRIQGPLGFSLFPGSVSDNLRREGGTFAVRTDSREGKQFTVLRQETPAVVREYWLDPGERFVPRWIVQYSLQDPSTVVSETAIEKYVLRDDDGWFVTQSSTLWLNEERMTVSYRAEEYSFKPADPAEFRLRLPENTLVREKASGMSFITGSPTPRALMVDEMLDQAVDMLEATASGTQVASDGSPTVAPLPSWKQPAGSRPATTTWVAEQESCLDQWPWLLAGFLAVLMAGLGGISLCRRRRPKAPPREGD